MEELTCESRALARRLRVRRADRYMRSAYALALASGSVVYLPVLWAVPAGAIVVTAVALLLRQAHREWSYV